MDRVDYECANCGHEWKGLPPEARASRGRPPCSECGRRTGQVVEEKVAVPTEELPADPTDPEELELEDGPPRQIYRCSECGERVAYLDRECPNGHVIVDAWTVGGADPVESEKR
jgi:DNA-directed RNA polymerase subunit RPC12/RpoP